MFLPAGTSVAEDTCYPRDAYQAVFHLDVNDVAGGEAVEIAAIYWDAFEAMACAPGRDDEAAAGDRAAHRKSADYSGFFDVRGGMIERAIAVEKQSEQPGQWKQAVVHALQRFNFLMTKRAAFDDHGHAEREKKYHTDKNYDAIELQGRIATAGDDEGYRADEKQRGAIEQRAAQRKFGGGGTEATGIAGVTEPFSPTVQTTRHL
jgi:hypothetical protein